MSIYVTGDTHGADSFGAHSVDGFIPRLNTKNFPDQKNMTKDDIVIICGDFGGVWDTNPIESSTERYALNWLDKKPFTTVFVPGNHENYDRLTGIHDPRLIDSWIYKNISPAAREKLITGYPQTSWNGGMVRQIRPSVFMAESGIFTIQGRTCLFIGGAASHDIKDGIIDPMDFDTRQEYNQTIRYKSFRNQQFRTRGLDWWPQEQPDMKTQQAILQQIENTDAPIEWIFTHSASAAQETMIGIYEHSATSTFLETIRQQVSYRDWYCGHYHMNFTLPGHHEHILYDRIIRIA